MPDWVLIRPSLYRQDAKNAKVAKEYKEFLCDLCAFALKKQA